jgi:hypothetical protein
MVGGYRVRGYRVGGFRVEDFRVEFWVLGRYAWRFKYNSCGFLCTRFECFRV